MENELSNEVYSVPQEETYSYTEYEQNSILLMSNTNDKIDSIYNCIMVTTMIILSFSLYMFFHNITKRKEI